MVGGFTPPFPKGLNCEKKFVPPPSAVGVAGGRLKYKNPKTAARIIIRIIIKSIKFRLVILLLYGYSCSGFHAWRQSG